MSFSIHEIGLTDSQLALSQATAKEGRSRENNLGELHVVNLVRRPGTVGLE